MALLLLGSAPEAPSENSISKLLHPGEHSRTSFLTGMRHQRNGTHTLYWWHLMYWSNNKMCFFWYKERSHVFILKLGNTPLLLLSWCEVSPFSRLTGGEEGRSGWEHDSYFAACDTGWLSDDCATPPTSLVWGIWGGKGGHQRNMEYHPLCLSFSLSPNN